MDKHPIDAWREACAALNYWKAEEARLRTFLVQGYFPNSGDGVHRFDLGNGQQLKANIITNYTVANGPSLHRGAAILQANPAYADVPARLFKWSPDLVIKVWKDAPGAVVEAFAGAITSKPGMPKLEIEDKK